MWLINSGQNKFLCEWYRTLSAFETPCVKIYNGATTLEKNGRSCVSESVCRSRALISEAQIPLEDFSFGFSSGEKASLT